MHLRQNPTFSAMFSSASSDSTEFDLMKKQIEHYFEL